ncbi:hypothetical protein FQZ97_741400 [compost metagenome]
MLGLFTIAHEVAHAFEQQVGASAVANAQPEDRGQKEHLLDAHVGGGLVQCLVQVHARAHQGGRTFQMAAQRLLRAADGQLESRLRRIADGDQANHGVDVSRQLAHQLAAHLLQPKPDGEGASQRKQYQCGERGEPAAEQAGEQRQRHHGDQAESEHPGFDHAHQPSGQNPVEPSLGAGSRCGSGLGFEPGVGGQSGAEAADRFGCPRRRYRREGRWSRSARTRPDLLIEMPLDGVLCLPLLRPLPKEQPARCQQQRSHSDTGQHDFTHAALPAVRA